MGNILQEERGFSSLFGALSLTPVAQIPRLPCQQAASQLVGRGLLWYCIRGLSDTYPSKDFCQYNHGHLPSESHQYPSGQLLCKSLWYLLCVWFASVQLLPAAQTSLSSGHSHTLCREAWIPAWGGGQLLQVSCSFRFSHTLESEAVLYIVIPALPSY